MTITAKGCYQKSLIFCFLAAELPYAWGEVYPCNISISKYYRPKNLQKLESVAVTVRKTRENDKWEEEKKELTFSW
jgi:hypothetical protein